MEKFIRIIFGVAFIMSLASSYVSAQIADFDSRYCYQILINNHEGKDQFALGVADDAEEACLQQMVIDETDPLQLWKLEALEDDIYHIVNLSTDKALGESSWRKAPDEGADQETSTSPTGGFDWNGQQPGVVQLTKDKTNEKQQWIVEAVENTNADALSEYIYQVKANWDLDSAKYWNFWNGGGGHGEGKKNIAIFPTVMAEADRIGMPDNYYGYYFLKTDVKAETTSAKLTAAEKIFRVSARDGVATISGDIEGKLVQVYSIQGKREFASVSTMHEVNVSLNKTGIYIVKVGGQVNKFVLK